MTEKVIDAILTAIVILAGVLLCGSLLLSQA